MRLAILSAPASRVVSIPYQNGADPHALPLLLSDRIANGDAFPDERVVRLPRRMGRAYQRVGSFAVRAELGR